MTDSGSTAAVTAPAASTAAPATRGTRAGSPRPAGTPITVSVIMPVCNSGRHLRRTLPALREAIPAGWELIVVDDHSTDDSVAVARPFADRVITSGFRRSAPAARNCGARIARGATLVFIDADIRVTREILERLIAALDRPGAACVFAVYSEGSHLRTLGGRFKNLWIRWSYLSSPRRVRWMNTALAAMRTADFAAVGSFEVEDDWLQGGNDIDFGRRVAEQVGDVWLLDDVAPDHLKELSLWGLLRNDFHRTRGFFRRSLHSREIRRVARGRWFGNVSPEFMGGVSAMALVPAGLLTAAWNLPAGAGLAAGGILLHGLAAGRFYAYALPRMGRHAWLVPLLYALDQAACALGLAAECASMVRRRLLPGPAAENRLGTGEIAELGPAAGAAENRQGS